MSKLVAYKPLTGDLRREVDRIVSGQTHPRTLWPGIGDDDPGFRLANPGDDGPRYQPGAEEAAAAAAKLLQPAPREVVEEWLYLCRISMSTIIADREYQLRVKGLLFGCSDLPGGVWTNDVLTEATRRLQFFPGVAELYAFLKPYADRLYAEAKALEDIVRGRRDSEPGTVTGSRKYLEDLVKNAKPMPEETHDRHFDPRGTARAQPPIRTVEEQLAALGYKPDGKTPL